MPQTVLRVEDDLDDRTTCRTVLEGSGYAVVEAPRGRAALEHDHERRPDGGDAFPSSVA